MIEAKLVGDPEGDEEGKGHSGSEAGDVNKRVYPVFLKIAYSNGEKVSEHAFDFGIQQNGG
jgi:hypothetical protein